MRQRLLGATLAILAFTIGVIFAGPGFFDEPPRGVNCLSGFIRLSSSNKPELIRHSSEHRQRFCIAASWSGEIETVSTPLTEQYYSGICGQGETAHEKRILLEEIMGAACAGLETRLKVPKAFILYGPKATNGKSEFINLVREMLLPESHSAIAPSEISKEQFLTDLMGKVANLTSELSSTLPISSDKMKAVISGDVVSAKRVYRPVFWFKTGAVHMFAANTLPTFHDEVDEGIRRRFIVIPFEHKIEECKIIADIAAKILKAEMETILSLAVDGAARLVARGQYSIPRWIFEETSEWFEDVDNLRGWLDAGGLDRLLKRQDNISYDTAYREFRVHIQDRDPREWVPRYSVFKRVVREYVKEDPELDIIRRSEGVRIIERVLV